MQTNRPKIQVPFQTFDYSVELMSISLILLSWVYTLINYNNLPEIIPTHFNAQGVADGYSNKTTIWLVSTISTVMYIGIFILNKYPHWHNYMVNITKENALKNYRFSTRVLRIVNFLCVLLFAYVNYHIIENAKGTFINLSTYFIPILIGVSVVLPIVLLIYMKKINS